MEDLLHCLIAAQPPLRPAPVARARGIAPANHRKSRRVAYYVLAETKKAGPEGPAVTLTN